MTNVGEIVGNIGGLDGDKDGGTTTPDGDLEGLGVGDFDGLSVDVHVGIMVDGDTLVGDTVEDIDGS